MNLAGIIGLIFSVGAAIFNAAMFCFIRFNDLRHLELTVKELKDSIDKYGEKLEDFNTRLSRLEGKIAG